jgi:hypothetical protein
MENISLTAEQLLTIEINKRAALERKAKLRKANIDDFFRNNLSTPIKQRRSSSLTEKSPETPLTPEQTQKIENSKQAALKRKRIKEQQLDEELLKIAVLYENSCPPSTLLFEEVSSSSSQNYNSLNTWQSPESTSGFTSQLHPEVFLRSTVGEEDTLSQHMKNDLSHMSEIISPLTLQQVELHQIPVAIPKKNKGNIEVEETLTAAVSCDANNKSSSTESLNVVSFTSEQHDSEEPGGRVVLGGDMEHSASKSPLASQKPLEMSSSKQPEVWCLDRICHFWVLLLFFLSFLLCVFIAYSWMFC